MRRAFTLIELLIVVAIIAILAAIAVPNFLEAQTRSKVSRSYSDLRSLATAIEAYRVDYNRYMPFTIPVRGMLGEPQIYLLTTPVAYITSIPTDVFQTDKPVVPGKPQKSYNATFGPVPRYYVYKPPSWPLEGWSMRTMGPDRDWDLVGDPADNESVQNNGYYDPTNGTLSNGDLLRFGGDAYKIP